MEINSNCVNCNIELNSDCTKFEKINLALPVASTSGGDQQLQTVQILEVAVRDILVDIYGINISQALLLLGGDEEIRADISVCQGCSFSLANLFLAHKTFSQTRHTDSLLSKVLGEVKEITEEPLEERFEDVEEVMNVAESGAMKKGSDVVEIDISDDINESRDELLEDNTGNMSNILSIIIPATINEGRTQAMRKSRSQTNSGTNENQVIVINVSDGEEVEEQVKGKEQEPDLPTPRSGVKVTVIKTTPTFKCPLPKKSPPFICKRCNMVCKTGSSYQNHMLIHMKDEENNGEKYLPCSSCNLEFQSADHLQQHRLMVHEYTGSGRGLFSMKDVPVSFKNSKDAVTFTVKLDPGLCQFPGCNFLAVSKDEAVDHYVSLHSRCDDDIDQARHLGYGLIQFDVEEDTVPPEVMARFTPTGPPPYNCEFCDFSVSDMDSLKDFMDHLRSHHLAVLQNFARRQNLNGDNNNCFINKNSPLDFVPSTFSMVFPEHTVHFSLPDKLCPYCSKEILCKDSWSPMKVHIREMHLWPLLGKTYKCPKCSKVFERRYVAKAHKMRCGQPDLRKKNKQLGKTYSCEKCRLRFANEKFLQNHLETRCGRIFSCEVCGLCFNKNAKLTSHMISHATERPFFCDRCGRNYKSRHALTFHLKISHTDEGRLKYNEMMRIKHKQRKLAQDQAKRKKGTQQK